MDEKKEMILPGSQGSLLENKTDVTAPTDYTADIMADNIKTLLIGETDRLFFPMFVIDFRNTGGQVRIAYDAIKSWVVKEEDIEQMTEAELAGLYFISTDGKLIMAGKVKDSMARQSLPFYISNMCTPDVKLYMQESQDSGMIMYKKSSVDAIKLYFAEE